MKKILGRRRWRLLVTMATVGLSGVLIAGPAHANANSDWYSDYFVDGGGPLVDDWGDHRAEMGHSLCYGCDGNNSDLVYMWQAILYAEGFLADEGIDGDFGPNTHVATKNWQARYGLASDGIVGNQTWTTADNRLRWASDMWVSYDATGPGSVWFFRGDPNIPYDDGAYDMLSADNGYNEVCLSNNFGWISFYTNRTTVNGC